MAFDYYHAILGNMGREELLPFYGGLILEAIFLVGEQFCVALIPSLTGRADRFVPFHILCAVLTSMLLDQYLI